MVCIFRVGEDGLKFFDGSVQNDPSLLAKNFSKASTSSLWYVYNGIKCMTLI